MSGALTRRTLIGAAPAALALGACSREAESREPADLRAASTPGAARPTTLKAAAPFPVGAAIRTDRLDDPAYAGLVARQFDQVTADWEMKMEIVLAADGRLDWTRPDRIAAFARDNGLRLFGHTLIWYAQDPPAFAPLIGDRAAFEAEFRRYIVQVAGRYAGQAVGWDVVNEAVDDDGVRLRGGYFLQGLGLDYIPLAFRIAKEADPGAILFLNDYNLEQPTKRATFLRLAERLLRDGVPLGGLGTQSHLSLEQDPAAIGPAMRELASLGLPIHVSEVDVTLQRGRLDPRPERDLVRVQERLFGALAEAFHALPERQRFAFTAWGVRDQDSWLRKPSESGFGRTDRPLLFDDEGRPKSTFDAVVNAWS